MSKLRLSKVLEVPAVVGESVMYAVRSGAGFDLYLSNLEASAALALNVSGGDVAELDVDSAVYQIGESAIYRAWERTDGAGYEAVSYSLSTGEKVGVVVDVLPVPADLTTLVYI